MSICQKTVGQRLSRLRKDANMTVLELARACGWKLSDTSGIETGRIEPTTEQIGTWQTKVAEFRAKNPHLAHGGNCTCR